jgi:primary-amine oxidase
VTETRTPDAPRRSPRASGGDPHPLDPLSGEEIVAAARAIRSWHACPPDLRFAVIALHEPGKHDLRAAERTPTRIERLAEVIGYARASRETIEAVVSLDADEVRSWRTRRDVQPLMMGEEFAECEALLRADPRWREAMRRRGVTDFALPMIDPWAAGHTGPADDPGRRRIARPLTFIRTHPDDNGYARPAEGLVCVVDLDRREVVEVVDHGPAVVPPHAGNYRPELARDPENWPHVPEPRRDLRPVVISQPDGPSFSVDGHHIRWQNWDFRIGFTPREGLVLHRVAYHDRGRLVLNRASLAEMYVPYGDPAPVHANKNVFDEGEYGLGFLANSLRLGCDCVGHIHYLDAVVNDQNGDPVHIPNAICLHEEDAGIGWKHTEFRTGHAEVRRSRRLVVSFFATAGNYDYGFFWHLYQDGSIEFEVKLTGIISTGAVETGETPRHGGVVAPNLYGPHHQHYFCARLDVEVDGPENSVVEHNAVGLPVGPDNPTGNAWIDHTELLTTEALAQRVVNPASGRTWTVINPDVRNALGGPVGYKLIPGENVLPPQGPASQVGRRGGFAYKHLWVTAYDPHERYAAGDYPAQNPGDNGLPAYADKNRAISGTDIVVWYNFGSHHVVRPEDWPVTPVLKLGFHLKPNGFFTGNPALDVPSA